MRVALAVLVSLLAVPLSLPAQPATASGSGSSFAVFQAADSSSMFAGEPSLGFEPHTGTVLFQAGVQTFRVAFDDAAGTATWTDVTPAQTSVSNNDPVLATDPVTGRTFAGGLDGDCSVLAYTDDAGATWS